MCLEEINVFNIPGNRVKVVKFICRFAFTKQTIILSPLVLFKLDFSLLIADDTQ